MYIYKSALRTEREFRLRSYSTNYLQKPDIELLEAVVEAKIVIRRLIDERNGGGGRG